MAKQCLAAVGLIRLAGGAVMLALVSGQAAGQVRDWPAASGGAWETASNWSPADVPDSPGESAQLLATGSYAVSVGSGPSIYGLEMGHTSITLNITGTGMTVGAGGINCGGIITVGSGSKLRMDGTLALLAGMVAINPMHGPLDGELELGDGVLVNGTGVANLLVLGPTDGTAGGFRAILTTAGDNTGVATLSPKMTLQGHGRVYGRLINLGTITGGSIPPGLELHSTITQQSAGKIVLGGWSPVMTIGDGGRVVGGSIQGTIHTAFSTLAGQSSAISGVTLTGGYLQVVNNSTLVVESAGMVDNGILTVHGPTAPAILRLDGGAIVSGSGVLQLSNFAGALTYDNVISTGNNNTDLGTIGSGIRLYGNGTLAGNLRAQGVVAPGNAIGQMKVTGAALAPSSTLEVELGGTDAAQRDLLSGTGAVALDGTLHVVLVNGYMPGVEEICFSYPFVSVGSLSGAFTSLNVPARFDVVYGPGVASLVYRFSDLNDDKTVDLSDFFDFLNAFDQTQVLADIDGNGVVELPDFFAFFNAFDGSC